MQYEWDEQKRQRNLLCHEVDFAEVYAFEWPDAVIEPDKRRDYGEERFVALAPIGDRLYVLVYTIRKAVVRVISFRKANRREVTFYVKKQDQDAE